MSAYGDLMASMSITAVSPDGKLMAVLTNRTDVRLRFRGASYRHYTDAELGEQLTAVTTRLFTGRSRARAAIMTELNGHRVADEDRTTRLDRRERRFRVLRAELVARGTSAGNLVRVSGRGMREWRVAVRPGTVDLIDAEQFADELRTAVTGYFADTRIRLAEIRDRVYGTASRPT